MTTQDFDALLADDPTTPDAPTVRRVPVAGDTIHATASGLAVSLGDGGMMSGRSVVLTRGTTFIVTSGMLDAAKDRFGNLDSSWLAIVHDPDAQIRRYGRVMVAPGPAPADMRGWIRGDEVWRSEREAARRAAHAEINAERRAQMLAEVERLYGPAGKSSTTVQTYGSTGSERAAVEQEREFAAQRVTGER